MAEKEKPTFTWKQKRVALTRHLLPYRKTLILLSAAEIVIAIGNGVIPYITGKFFDGIVSPHTISLAILGTTTTWFAILFLWVIVQLGTNLINWAADRVQRRLTTELEAGVQARAFLRLLSLPLSFSKTRRSGEITSTIDRSGWMLGSLANTVLSLAPQLLTVFIGIGISFALKPSLALVLLGGIGVYLLVLLRTVPETALRQETAFKVWKQAYGDASDAYTNIQTVKQSNAEGEEEKRIRKGYFDGAIPAWYRIESFWSNLNFSQRIIVTLTQLSIFALSATLVIQGELTIGSLIAFNAYAGMIIGPFVQVGNQWQTIQNALTAIANLDEIYLTPAENYIPQGAEPLDTLRGEVEFKNVHFAYENGQPEVLKGISFEVHAGEVVAFVGETGVGKSTSAELISAYYFPTEGSVEIDGHDSRKLNLNELRSQIAVVPQEVVLFNASIIDNIRYGKPEASEEEVHEAARKAHADVFIEKFPEKYNQEVGERGIKLSVGQKQRVAIARAILRDPKILILDEPTSALDAETEQYITASLEELMKGRTTFIIAHRLSTVRKADKIIVLKEGVVAEQGRHDELVKMENGVYRRLYDLHIGLHE